MKRLTEYVVYHPRRILLLLLVITVALAAGLPKLEFESSLDSVMPVSDREYILNEKVKDIYGNNGKFIILNVPVDTVSPRFLQSLNGMINDIEYYGRYDELLDEDRMSRLQELSTQGMTRGEVQHRFDGDKKFLRMVMRKWRARWPGEDSLDSDQTRRLMADVRDAMELKKKRQVDIVVSPLSVQDVVGENDIIRTVSMVPETLDGKKDIPDTEKEIAAFLKRLRHNPAFEGGIYATDDQGKISDFAVMVRLHDSSIYDPIVDEVKEITASYESLDVMHQGIPVLYREINRYMKQDLQRFIPMIVLVVMLIFFLNFRTLRGVLLPTAALLMTDAWVLGLMGHLGYRITVVGVALPPLLIAVGSSYAIHILNQYYRDMPGFGEKWQSSMIASMHHIALTVMLAGVTTFIGFIMLMTNQVSAIRQWGVFSAIGVVVAVGISASLLPAVLSLLPEKMSPRREGTHRGDRLEGILTWVGNIVTERSRTVLVVTGLIMALAVGGIFFMQVETSIHAYFKKGDPFLKSSRVVGEKYGGAMGLNILIDTGKEDGVMDPEFLKFIEEFREWMVAEEQRELNIGRTDAFGDFIKMMHMAMHNDDPDYYCIPHRLVDVQSYVNLYGGLDENDDGRVDDFESYVNPDFSTANVFARVWEREGELISSRHLAYTSRRVTEYLETHLPDSYSFKTSGEPKIIISLAHYVVKGQMLSLFFSLVVVFLMVVMLFQNWRVGFFALIPISVAVVFNFGVMGWTGVPLDLATAIIASITIGIGIDDTIHFMNTYRLMRHEGKDDKEAIISTLHRSGRAILYTSMALIAGFSVLVFSSFRPIMLFGVLVALTMVATTVGALVILPAAMSLAGAHVETNESRGLLSRIDLGALFGVR